MDIFSRASMFSRVSMFSRISMFARVTMYIGFDIIDLLKAACVRATVRTVLARPVDGLKADPLQVIQIGINEIAITGGRYLGPGLGWSDKDAAGVQLDTAVSIFDVGFQRLFNADTPLDQTTLSLPTGNYTLSCLGAGSFIASGGTAVFTGAAAVTEGNPNTITVTTAGTVGVVITGVLDYFQLEDGDLATAIMLSGAAEMSRDADIITVPTPTILTPQNGAIEFCVAPAIDGVTTIPLSSYIDGVNNFYISVGTAGVVFVAGVPSASFSYVFAIGTKYKVQFYWDSVQGMGVRAADASADILLETFATNISVVDIPLDSALEIGNRNGAFVSPGDYANNGQPICYASKSAAGWL